MNHYEVLGVAPDAEIDEIRGAYVAAARLAHPDFHEHDAAGTRLAAEARMRAINLAWGELRDPGRRMRYDDGLDLAVPGSDEGGAVRAASVPWRPYDPTPPAPFDERHDRPITSGGLPTWLRLAPVLSFVVGLAGVVLGAVSGIMAIVAGGLLSFAASAMLFVAAPLVALTTSRRGSRLR